VGRNRIPASPASPFYGFSAEVVAEWCGVSVGTAEHYKAGRRKPPTPVLRLFSLLKDGKVLGQEWSDHKVCGDKMFGPDNRYVRPSDIALMGLVWHALAEKDPESYYALLEQQRRA
jgi:hypothetical protein